MILISGHTCEIGKQTIKRLKDLSFNIITIGRKKNPNIENIFMDIDLNQIDETELLKYSSKISVFIHFAFSRNRIENNNKITNKIFKLLGKNIININLSSLSVYTNSNYGKQKKIIENLFTENSVNIRSGIIYSEKIGGFLNKIISVAKKTRLIFLPVFAQHKLQYITKQDDIIKIIEEIILSKKYLGKKIILVDKISLNLESILKKFLKRKTYIFYVNDKLFYILLKISNLIKLTNIDTDSLLSFSQFRSEEIYNDKNEKNIEIITTSNT